MTVFDLARGKLIILSVSTWLRLLGDGSVNHDFLPSSSNDVTSPLRPILLFISSFYTKLLVLIQTGVFVVNDI